MLVRRQNQSQNQSEPPFWRFRISRHSSTAPASCTYIRSTAAQHPPFSQPPHPRGLLFIPFFANIRAAVDRLGFWRQNSVGMMASSSNTRSGERRRATTQPARAGECCPFTNDSEECKILGRRTVASYVYNRHLQRERHPRKAAQPGERRTTFHTTTAVGIVACGM